MTDRQQKLDILKKRESIKNLQIIGNGEAFIDILEATVNELKDSLGVGVELTNADELLEKLETIEAFSTEVKNLKDSIAKIDIPSDIEIKGLDSLITAATAISKQKIPLVKQLDERLLTDITKSIVDLTLKVEETAVPIKQGQAPEDYVPMRRVMLVGKRLLYDDSFYTGGGGGGGGLSSTDSSSLTTIASGVVTRDKVGDQNTTITSSTAATTIVTAQAATYLDLTGLILTNTSATGSEVQLLDDDGTTVRAVFWCPATDVRGVVFRTPFNQSAVNKTWKLKTVTSIASLKVTAQYVENT